MRFSDWMSYVCASELFLDLRVQHSSHGLPRFLAGQVAGAAFAFAEDAHKLGERMFGRGLKSQRWEVGHKQFVGLGRPASLAASLAGVPLNNRFRCRLLPLSTPSFNARSEERRVGKEGVSTWRSRGSPYP